MRNDGHGHKPVLASAGAPKPVKGVILAIELGLVILLAYQLAQLTFTFLEEDTAAPVAARPAAQASGQEADVSRLTGFDPFYRQIAAAEAPQQQTAIPESSLKIEVFGLRAGADGQGSAIVKMQGDDDQKLVRVGEPVSAGVTLVGVYADRLEVRRRGNREAVYLRPQSERGARASAPTRPGGTASQRAASQPRTNAQRPSQPRASASSSQSSYSPAAARITSAIKGLALTPVRRNSRIVGFRMPDAVPPMVAALGLEAGDILLKANGSSLASFERIAELGEELAGADRLELEIERRGQTIVQAIDLR